MKKPSVFYLLADEDISVEDSIFSDFFDTKKTALKSVSKISKITQSKVLPCVCTYNIKKHKYIFQVYPELENFPSHSIENDCSVETLLKTNNNIEVGTINIDCGIKKKFGMQILPGESNMDGFYFSLLMKNENIHL